MRSLSLVAAALTLGSVVGCAQNSQQAVMAPAPGSGDTRTHDTAAVAPSNGTSTSVAGNWRMSNGFNSDPANPNGAPGPSTSIDSSHYSR